MGVSQTGGHSGMIAQVPHAPASRRVLIVSPHFPPINAPDMQRVRMSLPHYREFGWVPIVLAVDARYVEGLREPALLATVPGDVAVTRVGAWSASWTRRVGVGNLALRAFAHLARAGARLIRAHHVDCVYFSTTMFPAMALGRIWKARHGTPFVLDMQDPWLSTYHKDHPEAPRPPKYALAHTLDRLLEPWTMRAVDGLTAVSTAYIETLRARYPWIPEDRALTLPFGASALDFQQLAASREPNTVFAPEDGGVHAVYVGRGGHDMAAALRILFTALARLRRRDARFSRLRLHFVGTDYATPDRARKTVTPIADECGVSDLVDERTARVPYFEALQLLRDAALLLVIGSDDAQYTASKIYPYVLARKPLLAIVHDQSSVGPILRRLNAGEVVTFSPAGSLDGSTEQCAAALARLIDTNLQEPDIDWAAFAPFTAREMTRRQCALLDAVVTG